MTKQGQTKPSKEIEDASRDVVIFIGKGIIGIILVFIFALFLFLSWNISINTFFPKLVELNILRSKISYLNAVGILGIFYSIFLMLSYFKVFWKKGDK